MKEIFYSAATCVCTNMYICLWISPVLDYLDIYIFYHVCYSLREVVTKVAKKSFQECWQDKRVEFLPVDWRTWLALDKGR